MANFDNEPSLEKIDDYNGKESKEKKNTITKVVIILLIIGAVFAYFKSTSVNDDYVGTPENPGINTTKLK